MLVITRKINETIHISNDIVITITNVQMGKKHGKVSIGVEAPKDVIILRGELLDRVPNR